MIFKTNEQQMRLRHKPFLQQAAPQPGRQEPAGAAPGTADAVEERSSTLWTPSSLMSFKDGGCW